MNRLAEAQALTGKIDDALGSIEEALSANPEELLFWPHALTTRRELRLKISKPELAEADFREAIAAAHKIGANVLRTAREGQPRATVAR